MPLLGDIFSGVYDPLLRGSDNCSIGSKTIPPARLMVRFSSIRDSQFLQFASQRAGIYLRRRHELTIANMFWRNGVIPFSME